MWPGPANPYGLCEVGWQYWLSHQVPRGAYQMPPRWFQGLWHQGVEADGLWRHPAGSSTAQRKQFRKLGQDRVVILIRNVWEETRIRISLVKITKKRWIKSNSRAKCCWPWSWREEELGLKVERGGGGVHFNPETKRFVFFSLQFQAPL